MQAGARCKARAAQGGWGWRGDDGERSSSSAHGRSARESTRESGRVHRGKPRCSRSCPQPWSRRDGCDIAIPSACRPPGHRPWAAIGTLCPWPVRRTLPACRFEPMLLQGAWAAALHPANGTGLLRLPVPAVVSVGAGARTRRSTRCRAHGSTDGVPCPSVSSLSPQGRPRPISPAAPRRDAQSGQADRARHGGVGRPGLTPARAPSSCVGAPAWPYNP